jgi:nucleotide-binding universal stress UspA family protein
MPEKDRPAMLRSILIGLDGSAESAAARDLAVRWAAESGSHAVGLAVVDKARLLEEEASSVPGGHHWHVGVPVSRVAGARRRLREALGEFEHRCSDIGVRCRCLDEDGAPSDRLVAWSRRSDLVVLGRRARADAGEDTFAEGTLATVLKECPRPVVSVPDGASAGGVTIVAYDGSCQADRAIYAFVASGLAASGPVHVVTVDGDAAEAAGRAEAAVEYLASHDVEAEACPIVSERAPAEEILRRVRHLRAGLVVMGAYGQSALREFFLGSVTRSMLCEAEVPIFCHH